MANQKERYTLVRIFNKKTITFGEKVYERLFPKLETEQINCKTLKDAVDLGSCLSEEEKILGSYIFDNVAHKKLTLKGEY